MPRPSSISWGLASDSVDRLLGDISEHGIGPAEGHDRHLEKKTAIWLKHFRSRARAKCATGASQSRSHTGRNARDIAWPDMIRKDIAERASRARRLAPTP